MTPGGVVRAISVATATGSRNRQPNTRSHGEPLGYCGTSKPKNRTASPSPARNTTSVANGSGRLRTSTRLAHTTGWCILRKRAPHQAEEVMELAVADRVTS